MPAVDSSHILFIASVFEIVTQVLKGFIPDQYRNLIPAGMVVVGLILGISMGTYYGTEPVQALFEGFFGAATALGFYQVASRIPGVSKAFGSTGWIADSG